MNSLFVIVLLATAASQIEALTCPSCTYAEMSDELATLGFNQGLGTDADCKNGGDVPSTTCFETVGSGEKEVCLSSRAKMKLKVEVAGESASYSWTMYSKYCGVIDSADHPDSEGSVDLSEYEDDLDDLISDLSDSGEIFPGVDYSISITGLSGGVSYCSSNNCNEDTDISSLSGARSLLPPSLLLMALLALLAHFY